LSVSGRRFCRALRRAGWTRIKTKSGHQKFRHSDGRTVIVPVHGGKDLKAQLLRTLLKQTGLTEADL
jgi:predicted RNA binding protein YcfA (HicA-like mRNA interferase family)